MTASRPRFSIQLDATDRPDLTALGATLGALRGQSFRDWEALVDKGDRRQVDAAGDIRIREIYGAANLAANPWAAALGEFTMLLTPGDRLSPTALGELDRALRKRPDTDVIYTDEDHGPDGEGRKPDWSPELFRHVDFLGRATALRTSLIRDVGGVRPEAGPAAGWDLRLRVTERARRIGHLSRPLMFPANGTGAVNPDFAVAAVQRHLDRCGVGAGAVVGRAPGTVRLERALEAGTRISVVMPTRWQRGPLDGQERCFAVEAVRALCATTGDEVHEVVIVHDTDPPVDVRAELDLLLGNRLVLVPYDKPFNYSEKCNLGVLASSGDVLLLLNDDVEAQQPGWLASLVAPLAEPGVGLTGCKLLFPDGTVQHGGHRHASAPTAPRPTLAFRGWDGRDPGPGASLMVDREVSGVTGACVAIRRDIYERIGGLCEQLPINYNDVDFGLKVRAIGLRVLWVATEGVRHYESQSREHAPVRAEERDLLYRRWGGFDRDPYLPWPVG